jgi:hypothetical protein
MTEAGARPDPARLRVCLVKQKSTYDLYTKETRDLRALVASSNWRSGPLGLWNAFDCEFRLIDDDAASECQLGKAQWGQYVEGWTLYDDTIVYPTAEGVDWSIYDIVVSIDVAVPTRVITAFPRVMWCYYFIEGGPTAIDHELKGSPFFGYNVFLNHRLSKAQLTSKSSSVRQMRATRRAVLDFPYYMQSAHSIRSLYDGCSDDMRRGICLSHHSRDVVSEAELKALAKLGPVRCEWSTLNDIHRAELSSAYFVVHPLSRARAGTALIEAISAGCLVLAPSQRIWGFPELVMPALDFTSFEDLCTILRTLEADPSLYRHHRAMQARLVDEWCYLNPAQNLVTLLEAFGSSPASRGRQSCAEWSAHAAAASERAVRAWGHRAREAARRTRAARIRF